MNITIVFVMVVTGMILVVVVVVVAVLVVAAAMAAAVWERELRECCLNCFHTEQIIDLISYLCLHSHQRV